ncbi:MAG: hypothetical protein D6728_18005 [Cyanobacteria bacterium J055]|nr:MAG: hypothetical protein D6728_18005 [Cyanobacteria bacterium J055]
MENFFSNFLKSLWGLGFGVGHSSLVIGHSSFGDLRFRLHDLRVSVSPCLLLPLLPCLPCLPCSRKLPLLPCLLRLPRLSILNS